MPKMIVSIDEVVIKEVQLTKERTTLGRRPYNDIVIDNLAVKQDIMETGLDLLERIAPGLKDLIKGGTLMNDGIKLPSA